MNTDKKIRRQTRIRKNIENTADRMRLSVHRSNRYMYAQVFDKSGQAVIGLSEKVIAGNEKISPLERSKKLGMEIAKKAVAKKIKEVAFDKGRFSYHGRVKAVAEGAREGGLKF